MTNKQRREDILDRYYQVIAERNTLLKHSEQYKELTTIAKLTLDELKKSNETRHIMFLKNGHYDCRIERILGRHS
jgi:hypothetical protein